MKIDRLMSIIMLLLNQERISAQALADIFEVSQRTIYRDIDAIDLAGIPIRSISGVGGGFEIMPKYKLNHTVFFDSDLSAILMSLTSLSNMLHGDELIHAFAKVKSLIPPEKAKDIESKVHQVHVDVSSWLGTRNTQAYVKILKVALQESRLLSFSYVDGHGNKTRRSAEPYQLVNKGGHWYWQGYCLKRNDFRLFRVSRMSDLQMRKEVFTPRDYSAPQLDTSELLREMQSTIKLRIHKSILDRVMEYCSDESIVADREEYYIVMYPFIEKEYYYHMLLSYGNRCECLEPAHVRSELKRRIKDIAAMYES